PSARRARRGSERGCWSQSGRPRTLSPRALPSPGRASRVSAAAGARAATAARARPRVRPTRSLEQSLDRCSAEIALAHEAAGAALLDQWAVVGALATRDEDDRQAGISREQARGDLATVGVGQLDAEQDDRRRELVRKGDRGRAVHGLADDLEPLRREQRPRAAAEAGVVVDDQNAMRRPQLLEQLPVL